MDRSRVQERIIAGADLRIQCVDGHLQRGACVILEFNNTNYVRVHQRQRRCDFSKLASEFYSAVGAATIGITIWTTHCLS